MNSTGHSIGSLTMLRYFLAIALFGLCSIGAVHAFGTNVDRGLVLGFMAICLMPLDMFSEKRSLRMRLWALVTFFVGWLSYPLFLSPTSIAMSLVFFAVISAARLIVSLLEEKFRPRTGTKNS